MFAGELAVPKCGLFRSIAFNPLKIKIKNKLRTPN
jgi:hypothetical protein